MITTTRNMIGQKVSSDRTWFYAFLPSLLHLWITNNVHERNEKNRPQITSIAATCIPPGVSLGAPPNSHLSLPTLLKLGSANRGCRRALKLHFGKHVLNRPPRPLQEWQKPIATLNGGRPVLFACPPLGPKLLRAGVSWRHTSVYRKREEKKPYFIQVNPLPSTQSVRNFFIFSVKTQHFT